MVTGEEFLKSAQKYEGAKYSQAANLRTGPTHFDCSGLIWRAGHDLGLSLATNTVSQQQTFIATPLVRALVTPGAVLWRGGHDGISLGNTESIEARNYQYGVKTLDYRYGKFTHGLLVPGVTYSTPYPYSALWVDGDRGPVTMLAWKWWLRLEDNRLDKNTDLAMQRWLRSERYYKGLLDGDFGPMSITALQEFLKDAGFYSGWIDEDRGKMTVRAEQDFLNSRRKRLTK